MSNNQQDLLAGNQDESGPILDAEDEAKNKEALTYRTFKRMAQMNQIIYNFKKTNNNDQIKQFVQLVASLRYLGESREEDEEEGDESTGNNGDPSMLNHDHFFQICEAISKKNVRLQRKLTKSGGALNTG